MVKWGRERKRAWTFEHLGMERECCWNNTVRRRNTLPSSGQQTYYVQQPGRNIMPFHVQIMTITYIRTRVATVSKWNKSSKNRGKIVSITPSKKEKTNRKGGRNGLCPSAQTSCKNRRHVLPILCQSAVGLHGVYLNWPGFGKVIRIDIVYISGGGSILLHGVYTWDIID